MGDTHNIKVDCDEKKPLCDICGCLIPFDDLLTIGHSDCHRTCKLHRGLAEIPNLLIAKGLSNEAVLCDNISFLDDEEVSKIDIRNFEAQLCQLINRHSLNNLYGTPDYILATYIVRCLEAFNCAQADNRIRHTKQSPGGNK